MDMETIEVLSSVSSEKHSSWKTKTRCCFCFLFIVISVIILYGYQYFGLLQKGTTFIIWGVQVLYFPYRSWNINIIHPEVSNLTESIKSKDHVFKILYWTTGNTGKSWFGDGLKPCASCSYNNCDFTTDKQHYNTSNAVLFTTNFLHQDHYMPDYKFTNQTWILHSEEPPWQDCRFNDFAKFNGLFNATWTYSQKSDIQVDFVTKIQSRETPDLTVLNKDYSLGKNKSIAWFVSFCKHIVGVHSRRMQYVRNLQQHISVDIFGPCGTHHCDRLATHCDVMLKENYMFYLAFENSICDGYVTEKLERPLQMEVVPIVMGGVNYSAMLPPHSYIDVKDFKTTKDLAIYLQTLVNNKTLYNEYFKWHAYHKFDTKSKQLPACKLCEYLNKSQHKHQVYDSLGEFWNVHNNCTHPEKFYKNIDKSTWNWQSPMKTYLKQV